MSVEPDECDGGFVAECIEVPGAMGQGETEDEALRDLVEAINAIVAVRLEQTFEAASGTAPDGTRTLSVQF
jgi:predicted RNase H-like HicB family nuclease